MIALIIGFVLLGLVTMSGHFIFSAIHKNAELAFSFALLAFISYAIGKLIMGWFI